MIWETRSGASATTGREQSPSFFFLSALWMYPPRCPRYLENPSGLLKWALHTMTQRTQTTLQPSELVHRVKVGLPRAGRSRAFHTWTQLCTPANGFTSLAGEVTSTMSQECLDISTLDNPPATLLRSQIPFMPFPLWLELLRGKV